jgi:hypothetical protein
MSTAPVPESKQADSAAPKKAKHISDLTIENFRGLRKVELHGLGAVNLIVGQNNTGKTSLLEAVMGLADPNSLQSLPHPFRQKPFKGNINLKDEWLLSEGESFGSLGSSTGAVRIWKGVPPLHWRHDHQSMGANFMVGQISVLRIPGFQAAMRVRAVSVRPPSPEGLVQPFADAVRSPRSEQDMEAILKRMDSRICSVRLDYAREGPLITVDVGLSERVPLSHAGQGVYRIVSILSELLGQRPDICLIDELENGIHYSVLPQLWRGISEISSRLGIQVFVTTHSRECLEAATRVFVDEDPENSRDFAVIQLMRVRGEVVGRVLDEKRVAEALDNDIELR